MPLNYINGKIYMLVCNITGEIYIGSTCQPSLARRLTGHVSMCRQVNKGQSRTRLTSYNIIERGDYDIFLVENFPCDNKDELTKREGEVIRQMKAECTVVNCVIPGRTITEYKADNIEIIKAKKKKDYEQNKEKVILSSTEWAAKNKDRRKEITYKYYENNIEKCRESNMAYKERNRAMINEKCRMKYTCLCGAVISSGNKSQHNKTIKHVNFINSTN